MAESIESYEKDKKEWHDEKIKIQERI